MCISHIAAYFLSRHHRTYHGINKRIHTMRSDQSFVGPNPLGPHIRIITMDAIVRSINNHNLYGHNRFLHDVRATGFTIYIMQRFLHTHLSHLRLHRRFNLIIFNRTMVYTTRISSNMSDHKAHGTSFNFLHHTSLLGIIPILQQNRTRPLRLRVAGTIFSILGTRSGLPPTSMVGRSPITIPHFALVQGL